MLSLPPACCACVVNVKMAKRGAGKELTQDNWDQEEEEEEVSNSFQNFHFFIIALCFSLSKGQYFDLAPVANGDKLTESAVCVIWHGAHTWRIFQTSHVQVLT